MRFLILSLWYFFSGLELLSVVMLSPLTLACGIGLIGFTIKIAKDMKDCPHELRAC